MHALSILFFWSFSLSFWPLLFTSEILSFTNSTRASATWSFFSCRQGSDVDLISFSKMTALFFGVWDTMSFTFLSIHAWDMLSLFLHDCHFHVFDIVCDLLSSIRILCACVRFTASFFFWIEVSALLLPSELSDRALLHGTGVIAVNVFLCHYCFFFQHSS